MRGDNPNAKVDISREYKGLGEMDPHELWETTMNPRDPDAQDALNWKMPSRPTRRLPFSMGEKVEPRKEFIEQERHGMCVNLDI